MAKSDTYINYIIDQLKGGEVGFENTYRLMLTKFDLSRQTFSKYWKLAQKTFAETQHRINEANNELYLSSQTDAVKTQLMTRNDIQEKIRQIVFGELEVEKIIIVRGEVKRIKCKPDHNDILKAADIYNKMNAEYIQKTENRQVDKDGNDIIPTPYIVFTKTEDELIEQLNAEAK